MKIYKQGDIFLAWLDPSHGNEQSGTRPVVIISGNAFNSTAGLVIIVPVTSQIHEYFGSIFINPNEKNGLSHYSEAMCSHVRSISKERLKKHLGTLTEEQIVELHKNLNYLLTIN